jgi:lysyl endopeptidase
MLIQLKYGAMSVVVAVLAACGGGSDNMVGSQIMTTSASNEYSETIVVTTPNGETKAVALSADTYSPQAINNSLLKMEAPATALRPTTAVISLGAPTQARVSLLERVQNNLPIGVPLQVGFARQVQETSLYSLTAKLFVWTATPSGGKVAAIELKSETAKGVRIGILVRTLPTGAVLRFYTPTADKVTEVTTQVVNQTIQANLDAGDKSDNARTYWSPLLKGESGILEIELPVGVHPTALEISIPSISHAFLEPFANLLLASGNHAKGIGAAASCNVNVSCETPLPVISNAVAYMDYVENGNGYECTGTLLNDTLSSGVPYFLTANHCINNQTAASSLYTVWFAKSSACNTSTLSTSAVTLTTGATVLWTKSAASGTNGRSPAGTDTSFLRLNSQPPIGAIYAGWTAAAQAISAASYATVHHPSGDVQKISKGNINSYAYTPGINAIGSFTSYSSSTQNLWPLYRISWTSGITEGGSSGGGLFADYASNNPKLVGQLVGGSTSCTSTTGNDYYGRFDLAYQEALNEWLSPNMRPVYRFYNGNSQSYFMTNSVIERNVIQSSYPQFSYEGPSFFASPAIGAGLSPVYRFRNLTNGSYLWTISDIERAVIAQQYSAIFLQEDVAWYSRSTAAQGWVPLYRFRDITNGTYLFTASEIERTSILQNYAARFVSEGVAYYVRASL